MNARSRNWSVVAAHSRSLDTRLCLGLWPRPQFWRCQRRKVRPPRRPPRQRRRPQTRRSLGQSAVSSGEAGERNGARNAAPHAQSGAKSGAQDATSDGTRATAPQPPLPPSRKSSPFIRANHINWAASALAGEGRTARRQRASGHPRGSAQATARPRRAPGTARKRHYTDTNFRFARYLNRLQRRTWALTRER